MPSNKPKILVPMDFSEERGFFLKTDLVYRLRKLGAEIRPLVYDTDCLGKGLDEADGVLIPGGLGDVDPSLYGQSVKFPNVKVIKERSEFEFKLLEKIMATELPLLGICWGFQIINVFMGGTLIQDIESEKPDALKHQSPTSGTDIRHPVQFSDSEDILDIFSHPSIEVNSTHHQAIDKLGSGLKVFGASSDQIPECIQILQKPGFSWAVQWHPERLSDDPIIPKFLEACQRLR